MKEKDEVVIAGTNGQPLASFPARRETGEFNWDNPDNSDVAVPTQGAIAVYLNDGGCISIRQEALWNEDQDPLIYIHPRNVDALIERLQACKAAALASAQN